MSQEASMSAASQPLTLLEQNKLLVMRWFDEVWNQGRRETIFELLLPESVLHDGPKDYRGPDEFAAFHDALRAQLSDFRISPVISLAEGDRVCLHWSCSARHTASGKDTHVTGTSVVHIRDGRFIEAWQNWDAATLYTQLTGQALLSL
jgi:predicted SnoaL-like aldol condensation-catalyzing enzyme